MFQLLHFEDGNTPLKLSHHVENVVENIHKPKYGACTTDDLTLSEYIYHRCSSSLDNAHKATPFGEPSAEAIGMA